MRAEDAPGTPTQCHISLSMLSYTKTNLARLPWADARKACIEGSQIGVSLNSRLASNKEEEEKMQAPSRPRRFEWTVRTKMLPRIL